MNTQTESKQKKIQRIEGGITAPLGFSASGVACGIKKSERPDLALIFSEAPCTAAVVATKNRLAAAPVHLTCNRVFSGNPIHAMIINSGNANACTGARGPADAEAMADAVERWLAIAPGSVLVNSTGIIGHPLPMEKLLPGIEAAARSLSPEGGGKAAEAIITTDTHAKEIAVEVELGGRYLGKKIRVGGMAKGAGMIAPNMATMIAVLTTDAELTSEALQQLLDMTTGVSFNQISVDGCQSTNDMVVALANGASTSDFASVPGGPPRPFGGASRPRPPMPGLNWEDPELKPVAEAFTYVAAELAKQIARDGEGATKLIEVEVGGAKTNAQGRKAALAVVSSDLVKSAFFGNDPNWGRILAAVGGADVDLDPSAITLDIAGHRLVDAGQPVIYNAAEISEELKKDPVYVEVNLGAGTGRGIAWGCDLTYDYVRINADYTT